MAIVRNFAAGPESHRVSRWIAVTQDNKKPHRSSAESSCLAMVSSLPPDGVKSVVDDSDVDYEVAKDQIYSEVKAIEYLFKGLLSRIVNHFVQYLKHKAAQSYMQLYIVSPLGMGVGNLLNNSVNDQYVTKKLGLPQNATPETFSMPYEEVEVPSHFGLKAPKRCWLIRSKNARATKAFVLLHGWFGNMQSCLPFADALNKMGCLDTHHLLIVDLRDDIGRSFEANIGLKGVADLYDASVYLKQELGVDHISLYAQSISCVSALLFNEVLKRAAKSTGGTDCSPDGIRPFTAAMDPAALRDVKLSKIIMESPVANVRHHVIDSTSEYLKWLAEQFLSSVNKDELHIDKLSLQTFLRDSETCAKVYIMQGAKDKITTPEMLRSELTRDTLPSQVNLFLFPKGGHANLSATSNPEYFYALKHAIVGRNAWEFLIGKGPKAHIDDLENLSE
ncbi:uncharacterized protein BcabD6B2_11430 [Babesia caballi]|uniref:Serine aminopeptidase S33 domain-containing protein n=1 Tax=Babesia caballi TaxID=5871 RepID=A0AAV4LNG0_BABCB|nr:hypothetical protein, conserved [Babesia caballi]